MRQIQVSEKSTRARDRENEFLREENQQLKSEDTVSKISYQDLEAKLEEYKKDYE